MLRHELWVTYCVNLTHVRNDVNRVMLNVLTLNMAVSMWIWIFVWLKYVEHNAVWRALRRAYSHPRSHSDYVKWCSFVFCGFLGFFGTDCEKRCPRFCASSYCNRIFGYCECLPGLFGPACNQPCPANTWGPNCIKQCHCSSEFSSGCDPAVCTCIQSHSFVFVKSFAVCYPHDVYGYRYPVSLNWQSALTGFYLCRGFSEIEHLSYWFIKEEYVSFWSQFKWEQ